MDQEFETNNSNIPENPPKAEPAVEQPPVYQQPEIRPQQPPVYQQPEIRPQQPPVYQQPEIRPQQPPVYQQPEIRPQQTPIYHSQQPPVSEYPQQQPAAEPEVKQKPKKKKSGCLKSVVTVVLALILALSFSALGGVAGAIGMRQFLLQENGQTDGGSNRNEVDVLVGNREDTVIDIHKVDTSKQMTPAEVYALNVESTVGITTSVTTNYWGYKTTSAASGSGFIYSSDGYIITNFHVIEDSNSISVTFYDGTSLNAKVVGYDESNDLAVLKVEAQNLKPVILGNSANLNVGDSVLAIGNPLGELTFSLTAGTVSALNREVTFSGGITMNLIQTDCAINSGNSGGALFNLYGEVIGITNAKYSGNSNSGATIDNIGFAIPWNQVSALVESVIEKGYVVKPYIGVTVADVSQESLGYGLPAGASVQGIEENSPAQESGLRISDIITHINGEEISGASALKKFITDSAPGDELEMTVFRRGKTITLKLIVGERTNDMQATEPEPEETYSMMPGFPFFDWGY